MSRWLRNWKRRSDVEDELVQSRPTPPDHLVKSIANRVRPIRHAPATGRVRLSFATVVLVSVVALVAATGGFGYAAHTISRIAHVARHATHAQSAQPRRGISAPCDQYGVAPTVGSFSPTSGKAGASVTITGTNFKNGSDVWATSVKFNGVSAAFTVNSDTSISATVPSSATTGHISVTNCKGTAVSAGTFTVIKAPHITSFSPTSGKAGATVTLTGTGFAGTTSVKFHGVAATFTVVSNTRITTRVPSSATTGTITVTNSAGTAVSSTSFTVIKAPHISSFSPTSGKVGASVTITGTGFAGTTSVKFGGHAGTFTVASNTKIVAKVPTTGVTGKISVTNIAGTATSTGIFTVIKRPTVSSFSPKSGKVGTTVTIAGTNFAKITSVKFGTRAASFTVVSVSKITTKVPSGAVTSKISVTNAAGTGISSTNFTVTKSR